MENSEKAGWYFKKTSCFFHRLKGTLPHTNPSRMLSFFFLSFVFFLIFLLFFPGFLLSPCDSDQRLCLYLPLLCTASLYWTPYLISVSTGGSFALSHSSISGPAGSAKDPHQEDLIITVIVFTQSLWLWLPRTWPHLNNYLFHTQ